MKRNENIPLNFKERMNSKISLICSIAVLAVLCLFFHQLDYQIIQKPAIEAERKAKLKGKGGKSSQNSGCHNCFRYRSRRQSLSSVLRLIPEETIPASGTTTTFIRMYWMKFKAQTSP